MSYEKKLLVALDKVLDAVLYEEGRLAVINKFGTGLSDEEKAKATELITAQRSSLDHLYELYKGQLDAIALEISARGEEMEPLVSKLLGGEKTKNTMITSPTDDHSSVVNVSDVHEEAPAITNAANEMVASDAVVEVAPAVTDTTNEVVASDVHEETPAITNTANEMVASDAVVEVAPAVTDTTNKAVEAIPTVTDSNEININGQDNATQEESSLPFVLSPIDEGVTNASEQKAVEAVVEGTNAQLNAVEGVKTEIGENNELTPEEKNSELAKYTKISESAVRAILVTKAQFEKLLASRDAQKTLMTSGNSAVADQASAKDSVVELPDFTATDGGVIPVAGDANALVSVETSGETNQVILPTINDNAVTPTVDTSVTEGGDVSLTAVPAVDAANKQAQLQEMINQANTLYKEGKVAEAQELFDKVGALNKELQGEVVTPVVSATSGENVAEDPAVLVKK